MLRIFAIMAPSIAASMSASSNTMKGALPPSSMAGLTTLSAASCKSLRPTSVEPVNETTRTRGSCSIALTTLPDEREGMTLTTPAGTPASGSIDRSLGVLDGGARDRGNLVLGRRIEHVETGAVGGFLPFAADPKIGWDVGEKIVVHGTHSCPSNSHVSVTQSALLCCTIA